MDIFPANKPYINVCAPMVRYSKLEFRSLVRKYNCDLCFTPMIMADSFVQSQKARNNEFTTEESDRPLITQFAATNCADFASAAELVAPYCNGVDLNCGCPQRWAMKLGVGAQMLYDPDTIKQMIRHVKSRVSQSFSVSVKMRLLSDIRQSVDLCQQIEKAGADFITVHGRTKDQKSEPINTEALRTIVSSLQIPVIANGDVKSSQDADDIHRLTGCKGVMIARAILQNPAVFSGYQRTPRECVEEWVTLALSSNLYFITFHHHLVFMLEKVLSRDHRRTFNSLNSYEQVLGFLNDYYNFNLSYAPLEVVKEGIWNESPSVGKFFLEKTEPELSLEQLFL